MSRVVALDTETTGLDPDTEDVFEVATVDLHTGVETELHIRPRTAVVERMHPKAAEVNCYHERTAADDWVWDDEEAALHVIAKALDGAHILGAVPDFDTRHLTSLYCRFGVEPPRWHYHLIDVEAMAVGWLEGQRQAAAEVTTVTGEAALLGTRAWAVAEGPTFDLPWRSDDLSRACGVDPPAENERHTALGDARWAARWYRALTGEARL